MNTVIVYAHPWDKSYNHAILDSVTTGLASSGHQVDLIDLYRDGFDPVLPVSDLALYSAGKSDDPTVKEYQERLSRAEHLFFVFPVWWYDVPAILKGFLDRVLLKSWAYDYSASGIPKGLLGFIEKTTVISTMKSPSWYYKLLYRGALKSSFIKGTLKFCGLKNIKWFDICNIEGMGEKKRMQMLDKLHNYALRI